MKLDVRNIQIGGRNAAACAATAMNIDASAGEVTTEIWLGRPHTFLQNEGCLNPVNIDHFRQQLLGTNTAGQRLVVG